MAALFDGTCGTEDIAEILDRMKANCPQPSSNSRKLWRLRHATDISGHNRSRETLLEKSVAMLAGNGHMPGWFNQCPAASGIGDSSRNRHSSVDLVHWTAADKKAVLVELKWDSDSPSDAVRQILRYGAAYLFCRMHRDKLPLVDKRCLMSARHVALRVAAPARYYDTDETLRERLSRARASLESIDPGKLSQNWSIDPGPEIRELSMSLDVLAFPDWFDRLPFTDGAEVRSCRDGPRLTDAGRRILDAFGGLAPVCHGEAAKS